MKQKFRYNAPESVVPIKKIGCSRTFFHSGVMKKKSIFLAMLAASSVMLSSCFVTVGPHGEVAVGGSGGIAVDSHGHVAAWTNASYDAAGFPIYGYYYGRPVYGYDPYGAAVFTFGVLTAACIVPAWGPAPWYCGH